MENGIRTAPTMEREVAGAIDGVGRQRAQREFEGIERDKTMDSLQNEVTAGFR